MYRVKFVASFLMLCGFLMADTQRSDFAKALELLDTGKPELSSVQTSIEQGNERRAFEQYKHILVNRVSGFDSVKDFSYWLYGPANADELLEGILTTQQYGKPVRTIAKIGMPGSVQWYRVPDDGYTTLLRDITTMHWTTKLAEKYRQTGDLRYLKAWQGYWDDFVTNWPAEYEKAKRNPETMALVEKQSIKWSDIALYIGWRLESFEQAFNAVCHRAVKDGVINEIDSEKLARLLVHLDTFEAAKGIGWIERDGGVPNQRVHCATAMFELGVYLSDFENSGKWRQLGVKEVQRSGFLPDGTDMEQSLNYNKGLVKTIDKFLHMSAMLPKSEKGPWLDNLKHMYKYRYYYLHSIVKPDGSQPIIGKNNTWRKYDEDVKDMPGLTSDLLIDDFSMLPLSKTINEYIYQSKDVSPPAFDSIYFPYGGYVVLRDGWDSDSLYCFMKTSRPGNGHMKEAGNGIELSALGANLIVNSGGELYNPDLKHKGFWYSTSAQNSISVDGYSQDLKYEQDVPVTYKEPINARFLAGDNFDFIEGKFRGVYAGWNFKKHGTNVENYYKLEKDVVIDDVTHDRQVIFLRHEGIFIVTDIIDSAGEHKFTQSWLLAPEFTPGMVDFKYNTITATRDNGVSLVMYQSGIGNIEYAKPYGVMEEDQIIGWLGKAVDEKTGEFSPAVDVLCEWSGTGKQVLITVIVPYNNTTPVSDFTSRNNGFEMKLADGGNISYRYGSSSGVEAVCQSGNCILTLKEDNVFETDSQGKKVKAIKPNTFKWEKTSQGEMPVYN
ncbi:MAG: heparinase II/III family protein [Sedimentisphaeraceae bacterium JB056]